MGMVTEIKKRIGKRSFRYKLFGEWLVSHTIVYPDDRYQNAYFYDVWDTESERYLEQDKVEDIVKRLNLIYVPVFYKGEFESWKHLKQFVGRTDLGGENGEGIVVKNMSKITRDEQSYRR